MSDFVKISYYDLKLEALNDRLEDVVGRKEESLRMARILNRHMHNNCLVVGLSGVGKTAFIRGFAKQLAQKKDSKVSLVELEAEDFFVLGSTGANFSRFEEALSSLSNCVLFIDNFGSLVYNKPNAEQNIFRLFKPLLEHDDIQVILSLLPHEQKWLQSENPAWNNFFEIINLKIQPVNEQLEILKRALEKLRMQSLILATNEILESIIRYVERFPVLGPLPGSAIKLLDESLALAKVQNFEDLSEGLVQQVVADKTGIPLSQLQTNEVDLLKNLETNLNQRIVSQKPAIAKMAAIIQRAKLGLKNPNRPLGSFLVLGPSGVGKTETAKVLAELVFGKKESFVRIDMSEFGQEHAVQRLIGAPPGYVGYDAGGGLTNPVKDEPYSLILLDEIEKAHPKIFDVFLQVLDDGRLTSGQGETVDFRQTIVMATSNLAVPEILEGFKNKENVYSEEFIRRSIMPVLTKAFRVEFINRFDSIVIFNPLGIDDLLKIAQLEIKNIEKRVSKHKIKFDIDPKVLAKKIERIADFRLGARPVKRFIEETCETLIAKALLK